MRRFMLGIITGAVIAGSVPAIAAATDSPNDRRDVITCTRSAQEDDHYLRAFDRLADGRARLTFACPK